MLKALGKQSQFINGLRVTDAETRDVALMVLAGKVNKGLVAALTASSFALARSAPRPTSASSAKLPPATRAGSMPSGS